MALPSTGSISLSQINVELGRASNATISLNTAEDGGYATINSCSTNKPSASNPATVSEWYNYNHTQACAINCSNTVQTFYPGWCGAWTIEEVYIGSLVGTVNINYTYTLSGGFTYHNGLIFIEHGNENVVASTGNLEVGASPLPSSISGTLSFYADGSISWYRVWMTDQYCY